MVTFANQIYLLLWKNVKLQQRNKTQTLFEVISPLFAFIILVMVRLSKDFHKLSPACQFKPIAMGSAGPLEALRAFCFLGVCRQGNQGFGNEGELFNETEFQKVSQITRMANQLLNSSVAKKFSAALLTIPSDMSKPKGINPLKLDSMFKNAGSKLFVGVTASPKQRDAVLHAIVPSPKRWNLRTDAAVQLLLNVTLQTTDILPNLLCRARTNSSGWSEVQIMCRQAAFRENLKDQFDLSAFLDQITSSDPNKHDITIEGSDVMSLKELFKQMKELQNSTMTILERLSPLLGPRTGQSTIVDTITLLGQMACGSVRNNIAILAEKSRHFLSEQYSKKTDDNPMPTEQPHPMLNANASLDEKTTGIPSWPVLNSILPPEEFCNDKLFRHVFLGPIGNLLSVLGMSGIVDVMFGVIPYYPDTPRTRQFLSKLNKTLQEMSSLSYLAEEFTQSMSPQIETFISGNRAEAIRMILLTCEGVMGKKPSVCSSLLAFLEEDHNVQKNSASNSTFGGFVNWRDSLNTINSLMYKLYYASACFRMNKLYGFNSTESLEKYTHFLLDEFGHYSGVDKPRFLASVLFDNQTSGFVKYRLRFQESTVDDTRNFDVVDEGYSIQPRNKFPGDFKYFTSFFIHIQELLEHGIQAAITGVDVSFQTYLNMFPSSCYNLDTFTPVISEFLPMIMTISWIYNVSLLVNAIVYEKESRLKEMMKIMGLSDGVHWLSWFTTSFILMAFASILMTLLLKTGQIIVYSNPFLLFLFIISFVVSTICEAFFISIFFSSSSVAAAFAGIIYFLGHVPYIVFKRFAGNMCQIHYVMSCLIPQLAFGIGCDFIGKWERNDIGLQTSNFLKSPAANGRFKFHFVILMLWVDSAIFMLLAWYLEKLFPGPYGVPKPWYFPFTYSFWCGQSRHSLPVDAGGSHGSNPNNSTPRKPITSLGYHKSLLTPVQRPESDGADWENTQNSKNFEEEPRHLPVGIAVRNLTKIYEPGFFACKKDLQPLVAVNNLSYNFYEGQVTSFLGHNGAGKSTTMSVLTGLYTPTSGTAYIAGYDIRTDMDEIRKHLGLCPQYNVLFDTLTVEDHIYFYGMLKGLSKAEVEPQIDDFIADVGLQKKRHEMSMNLSGGMKRKLSVAMAFVGGSKIVVLDEPTAGVDPHARRAIWEVLAKFRRGRTIILTTHHMDEADILGDRICIINKGRLVCSGSPMFLKKVFGEGYTLTLVKNSFNCDAKSVLNMARSVVSEASLGECTSSEINVKLPYNSVPKLANLFELLDKNLTQLGIASYGIEDSSLEEIFLTVTSSDASYGKHEQNVVDFFGTDQLRQTRHPQWQQMKALWIKRLHVLRRSKIGFIAEFILPAVFIFVALALLRIVPTSGDSPPMELAPWYLLGKTESADTKDLFVFQSHSLLSYPKNATLMDASERLINHMNSTDFLGTRCMRRDLFNNSRFPCIKKHKGSSWSPAPTNLPSNTSWCQCSAKKTPNAAKCVDWPAPAQKSLMSADILESMQGYNLTNYIQSTVMQYYRRRFGGYTLSVNDTHPVNPVTASVALDIRQLLMTISSLVNKTTSKGLNSVLSKLEKLPQPKELTSVANQVWFENRGYLSAPAYLNILTNAMMRALADKSLGPPEEIGVSGWTHPITSQVSYVKNVFIDGMTVSALTVVSIIFALSFIPASFVLFLISEKTTNAKHLQFVSGISPILYWIVNHVWNLLNYLVPLTTVILLFVMFKNYEFVGKETIGPFVATLVTFGFASAPIMYLFSWVMSVPSKAFTMLTCINLGLGFVTTMSVTIIRQIGTENNDKSMTDTAQVLRSIFLFLPHFCLGQALMDLITYYQVSAALQNFMKKTGANINIATAGTTIETPDTAWDAARVYVQCMAIQGVFYFMLVLLLEYNCCCKQGLVSSCFLRIFNRNEYSRLMQPPDPTDVDDDVRAEAAKVEGSTDRDHLLELRRLTKIFLSSSGPKAAVRGISLGVKSHECFGFLGVNGAGKTTTFKMLTGDLVPTSGDAFVSGFSILTDAIEVHKQLGYCPQFDALLPLLTGRETLQLYARIRGVEEADIDELVETIAKRVGIEVHLDKTTQEYSGGNKRKLSCGIAFIGNPPIVFLDEPTAGMDPGARRFLWRCIQRMVAAGSCIILTTHSMEDCQALCHRLTIMVNGRLQCIGSPQHLKNKFGQGFTIFLRVRPPAGTDAAAAAAGMEAQLEKAHKAFMAEFPEATLSESHASVLQYQLKQTVQLRSIFASVQKLKDNGLVLDYSVNQTTLDQIFINFAKIQTGDL